MKNPKRKVGSMKPKAKRCKCLEPSIYNPDAVITHCIKCGGKCIGRRAKPQPVMDMQARCDSCVNLNNDRSCREKRTTQIMENDTINWMPACSLYIGKPKPTERECHCDRYRKALEEICNYDKRCPEEQSYPLKEIAQKALEDK